jgi:Ca2+-transporting ATPase
MLEAVVVLGVFLWAEPAENLERARSLAFSTLIFAELLRAFAARSATRIFWEVGAFTNKVLLGVVTVFVLLQIGLYEIPAVRHLFALAPLSRWELVLAFALGLIPVTVLEVAKLLRRWIHSRGVKA